MSELVRYWVPNAVQYDTDLRHGQDLMQDTA